jgi:hypothetical protein
MSEREGRAEGAEPEPVYRPPPEVGVFSDVSIELFIVRWFSWGKVVTTLLF